MTKLKVKRGDIFYTDLSPVVGSEQGGIRPVLIIQNDIANKYSPTVIIAAITSQINEAKLPTHVEISSEEFNLPKDSVIILEQIKTIDKRRLKEKIDHITNELMQEVEDALFISEGMSTKLDILQNYNQLNKKIMDFYRFILNKRVDIVEDYEHEYKEVKGSNPVNSVNGTIAEYAASFLNSRGGKIYYGISDDRVVKGVKLTNEIKDKINQTIYSNLANISPSISPDHYDIIYHDIYNESNERIENLYIIEVGIPSSYNKSTIYFVNGNNLYVRVNGIKKKLIGTEIVTYIRKKLIDNESL